ncbi:MAG: RHS repeat protein, partial [Chloroflexota bacterium]
LTGVYTVRLTVRDLAGTANSVTSRTIYLENTRRGELAARTRVPFDLGGGYQLGVGVANGEASLTRDLFSIPSYGPPQALSLEYSSAETTASGKFGVGWVSNLTQYLTFESGFVVWHRADGGRVPFGSVAGVWTPLASSHDVLAVVGSTYTITQLDQTVLTFQNVAPGRLTKIQDRFGQALSLAWTASSATATDASSRVTAITINSANDRITDVTDSAGRHWGFAYSAANDLITLTDPASKTTTFAYDALHRMTTVTRSRSQAVGGAETLIWRVGYGTGGATTVTDPLGDLQSPTKAPTEFTYGTNTTTVERLRVYGQPVAGDWISDDTSYALDDQGRVTSMVDPLGATTSSTYNAASDLLTITRPIDATTTATTTYTYDARGNVLTELVPLTGSTSVTSVMTYSATNDLLTRTEADSDSATRTVTKYGYDGSGHLTSVNINCTTSGTTPPVQGQGGTCTGAGTQDASTNLITTYTYTAQHQLDTETDPLGRVTKHTYDTLGTAGATYGFEVSVTANYVSGQSATSERNVVTSQAYDQATTAGKAGLATSSTDALSNVTTYAYDALSRQISEVLPSDGSIPALTRTTTFDELGNVLTESETWPGLATPRVTTHVYDLVNRETRTTDPAGTTADSSYDAAGNGTGSVGGGITTARTFDGVGRVVSETITDPVTGPATTTHAYDLAGREVETTNPEGELTDRT